MKLREYKLVSHNYTRQASEIGRKLSFIGIGIIWIISNESLSFTIENRLLLTPLLTLSLSLLFDFAQYLLGGVVWIQFYRSKINKGADEDTEFDAPKWRANILYFLYYLKVILLVLSYILIVYSLFLGVFVTENLC